MLRSGILNGVVLVSGSTSGGGFSVVGGTVVVSESGSYPCRKIDLNKILGTFKIKLMRLDIQNVYIPIFI